MTCLDVRALSVLVRTHVFPLQLSLNVHDLPKLPLLKLQPVSSYPSNLWAHLQRPVGQFAEQA